MSDLEKEIVKLKDHIQQLEYIQKLDMAEKARLRRQMEIVVKESEETIRRTKKGTWRLYDIYEADLADETIGYIPMFKCPCCYRVTDSHMRLAYPTVKTMDCPKFCGWCGAEMAPVTELDFRRFAKLEGKK